MDSSGIDRLRRDEQSLSTILASLTHELADMEANAPDSSDPLVVCEGLWLIRSMRLRLENNEVPHRLHRVIDIWTTNLARLEPTPGLFPQYRMIDLRQAAPGGSTMSVRPPPGFEEYYDPPMSYRAAIIQHQGQS